MILVFLFVLNVNFIIHEIYQNIHQASELSREDHGYAKAF